MRAFINLFDDTSTGDELVLVGGLDIGSLLNLLPQVTNASAFETAIGKLKSPGIPLIPEENAQLALAFISLLDADPQTRGKIIAQMASLSSAPVHNQQSTTSGANSQPET